jgi:hypothetical protein
VKALSCRGGWGSHMSRAPIRAVAITLFVLVGALIGPSAASSRPSQHADACSFTSPEPVSAPSSFTTSCDGSNWYTIHLGAGDIVRVIGTGEWDFVDPASVPISDPNEISLWCGSDWSASKCGIPRAGEYILLMTGAGNHYSLSVSHSKPQRGRRTGSCTIASARRVPLRVTQFSAGAYCTAGREFFKLSARAGERVVFSYHPFGDPNGYPGLEIFPPNTTDFTLSHRKPVCRVLFPPISGGLLPCHFRHRGTYVIETDSPTMQFRPRLKYGTKS